MSHFACAFEKIEDAADAVVLDQPVRFDELLEKFVKDLTNRFQASDHQIRATPRVRLDFPTSFVLNRLD
jgi:hypothetical protein